MATVESRRILKAVRNVLDSAAGNVRTIASTAYDGSAYPGQSDEEKSKRGTVRPTFHVAIEEQRPSAKSPPRNGSVAIEDLTVVVIVSRHVGPLQKVSDAERDAVMGLASEDGGVIAQALEWPGNLTLDSDNNATGLIGGCLTWLGSRLDRVEMAEGRAGVVETSHRFRGIVQVTQAVA